MCCSQFDLVLAQGRHRQNLSSTFSCSKCVNILERQERDRLRQVEKWFLQLPELIISFFDSTIGIRWCALHDAMGTWQFSFFLRSSCFVEHLEAKKKKMQRKKRNLIHISNSGKVISTEVYLHFEMRFNALVCSKHILSPSCGCAAPFSQSYCQSFHISPFSRFLFFGETRVRRSHSLLDAINWMRTQISYFRFLDGFVVGAVVFVSFVGCRPSGRMAPTQYSTLHWIQDFSGNQGEKRRRWHSPSSVLNSEMRN